MLSKPQYKIPEIIYVESKENIKLLSKKTTTKLSVLYNWPSLSKPKIEKTKEQIFKYLKSSKNIKTHAIYSVDLGLRTFENLLSLRLASEFFQHIFKILAT